MQFSPKDYQAIKKLLDSMNDGKTLPEPPTKDKTETEPPPKDTESEKEGEKETEDGKVNEKEEVSNIHVAAKIGAVKLLLHSKDEHLAMVKVVGMYVEVTKRLCINSYMPLYRTLY